MAQPHGADPGSRGKQRRRPVLRSAPRASPHTTGTAAVGLDNSLLKPHAPRKTVATAATRGIAGDLVCCIRGEKTHPPDRA